MVTLHCQVSKNPGCGGDLRSSSGRCASSRHQAERERDTYVDPLAMLSSGRVRRDFQLAASAARVVDLAVLAVIMDR